MILITVGTQKFQFDRLLKAVDDLVGSGEVQEEVFAQSGFCTCRPKHYPHQPWLEKEEWTELLKKADIVITHGGTASIVEALRQKKKVIAVPRLKKYGEHVDNHQMEIVKEFSTEGLLLPVYDMRDLGRALREVRQKEFLPYVSKKEDALRILRETINAWGPASGKQNR